MSVLSPALSLDNLRRRIDDGTAVLGVIGLGYVGLPLAIAFAEENHEVVCFDVDATKIEALNESRPPAQVLTGS